MTSYGKRRPEPSPARFDGILNRSLVANSGQHRPIELNNESQSSKGLRRFVAIMTRPSTVSVE